MRTGLVLNSTQIPNFILDELMPILSHIELRVLLIISRQTYGWHKDSDRISYSQLVEKTGASKSAVIQAVKSLREKGLIKVTDRNGKLIQTKEDAQSAQELFYQINVTSPKIGHPLSKNWTGTCPKIGHTKETLNTLPNGKGRVTTSCPLLKDSPLQEKYPNGHHECVEYLQDEEKDRGSKFINLQKQYQAIHKILRAGYGFDVMNKTIRLVEKKYGKGAWDYSTLSNWIEKGSANGN